MAAKKGKQRHIPALAEEFVFRPLVDLPDDPLGTAIETRGNALVERGNLRDPHSLFRDCEPLITSRRHPEFRMNPIRGCPDITCATRVP